MSTEQISLSYVFPSSTFSSSSSSSSSSSILSSDTLPIHGIRFHKSSRRSSAPSIALPPEVVVNSITASGTAASSSAGTSSPLKQKNPQVQSASSSTAPSHLFSKQFPSIISSLPALPKSRTPNDDHHTIHSYPIHFAYPHSSSTTATMSLPAKPSQSDFLQVPSSPPLPPPSPGQLTRGRSHSEPKRRPINPIILHFDDSLVSSVTTSSSTYSSSEKRKSSRSSFSYHMPVSEPKENKQEESKLAKLLKKTNMVTKEEINKIIKSTIQNIPNEWTQVDTLIETASKLKKGNDYRNFVIAIGCMEKANEMVTEMATRQRLYQENLSRKISRMYTVTEQVSRFVTVT